MTDGFALTCKGAPKHEHFPSRTNNRDSFTQHWEIKSCAGENRLNGAEQLYIVLRVLTPSGNIGL